MALGVTSLERVPLESMARPWYVYQALQPFAVAVCNLITPFTPQNGLPCPSTPSMPGISAPLLQGLELASDILRRMWLWVVSNTNTRRRSR